MGVETIAKELDRLYQFDMNKYLSECDAWKKYGYRIFRNAEGKHKVVPNAAQQLNEKCAPYMRQNIAKAVFGDLFGDIFTGVK